MIEKVKKEVFKLLNKDKTGHNFDHVHRVLKLALHFSEEENVNVEILSLIALLHDVDDFKLFGDDNSKNLYNARRIMTICKVDENIQEIVCTDISKIGYRKRLNGSYPETLEGKFVSDADMCDALGANGLLRLNDYIKSYGVPFFNKNIFPSENKNEIITKKCSDSGVCHVFEKLLKLKNLMLTEKGKEEAIKRHDIVVQFLYHLFDEENSLEWVEYLNNYLKN